MVIPAKRHGVASAALAVLLLLTVALSSNHSVTAFAENQDERLLSAYIWINSTLADLTHGGHHGDASQDGFPLTTYKYSGGEALAIRASCAWYRSTNDTLALQHAVDTFNTLQSRMLVNATYGRYYATMTEDWSAVVANVVNVRSICLLIFAMVDLYTVTGNTTYYKAAVQALSGIRQFHRDHVHGGYYLNVATSDGSPSPGYGRYGLQPGYVAMASATLLTVEPTNATFLAELNYALNFSMTTYWDSAYGGYCSAYDNGNAILDSAKSLEDNGFLASAFAAGYLRTGNSTYLEHAKLLANFVLIHYRDPTNLGFYKQLTRSLSMLDNRKDSHNIAVCIQSLLDLWEITENRTFLDAAAEAYSFIFVHNYDSTHGGFFAITNATGFPDNTDKLMSYQTEVLLAGLRLPTPIVLPPITLPPETITIYLLPPLLATLLSSAVVSVCVLAVALVVVTARRRPGSPTSAAAGPLTPTITAASFIRRCSTCGAQYEPGDRFCQQCGRSTTE